MKLNAQNVIKTFLELFHLLKLVYSCTHIFLGCDESRYGVGCGSECSNKCKNRHCDAFNGFCIHGCTDPNALTSDCIGELY